MLPLSCLKRTERLQDLDIEANRKAQKWSHSELVGRALWEILRGPLFNWTPRPMWAWRRWVLRFFGARIGRGVHIHPTVRIAVPWNLHIADEASVGDSVILYSLGSIFIGRRATVSQHAHLCAGTHDHQCADMPLIKSPISIGSGTWICTDAFVGPGVTIGEMAIVGARAVIIKDIAPNAIVVGNPGRIVGKRKLLRRT